MELISRPYPIGPAQLSAQVYVGPCILESVFQMEFGAPLVWTIFDGMGPGARIVMQGNGLGQLQPFSFPLLCSRLDSGLFFQQGAGGATGWTFNVWAPGMRAL